MYCDHITKPHINQPRKHPFMMVYNVDTMLLVKINRPTWRREHFNKENNQVERGNSADLIEKIREMSHIQASLA